MQNAKGDIKSKQKTTTKNANNQPKTLKEGEGKGEAVFQLA